jgi:hypothetical protein
MLSDPLTIDVGGGATAIPKVQISGKESTYATIDEGTVIKVSHSVGRRARRSFRVDLKKVSADVFLPATNVSRSMSCYIVFDMPLEGYTAAEAVDAFTGLNALLSASTDAVLTAFLGGQH